MKRTLSSRTIPLLACGSLLLLAAAGPAEARHGGRHGRHFGKHLEQLGATIGVSDATKSQIKQLITQSRQQAETLRAELRTERKALRELMRQDAPSEAAVMGQADKIGALKLELKKRHLRTMLQVHQLLTPEQRQALQELRQKRGGDKRAHRCGGDRP